MVYCSHAPDTVIHSAKSGCNTFVKLGISLWTTCRAMGNVCLHDKAMEDQAADEECLSDACLFYANKASSVLRWYCFTIALK